MSANPEFKFKDFSKILLMAGTALTLAACASEKSTTEAMNIESSAPQASAQPAARDSAAIAPAAGTADSGEISDPFEKTNRSIFKFNTAVDHAVIHPIVKGYRAIAPQPVRTGVRNFLRNLKSPTTFANQLLQGDIGGAGDVLARAVINSTVGIGGLIDVAGKVGFKYEQEDFGQTMGVWGVPNGPYVVVPVLGPSSLRDYAGYFVDGYADPLRWWLHNIDEDGWYYAKLGADYLDLRDSVMDTLVDLEKSSIDYYAAVRSIYYQRRDALVRDEQATAMPDFDESN